MSDGGFSDPALAVKTRDALTTLMIRVLDQERPDYTYGTVTQIDPDLGSCLVLLVGDTTPVRVKFGAMRPARTGQVVRVSGSIGDRFISDVIGGSVVADSPVANLTAPTNLVAVANYRALTFRWDIVTEAFKYELQVADNSGFSVNLRSFTLVGNEYTLEPLTAGTTYYARVRVLTTYSGTGPWSATASNAPTDFPVTSLTDGLAPAASPQPTVTPGIGYLLAQWLPQSNLDPVTYEVHVSTVSGFTPSAATKVSEVSGTFAMVRSLPGTTTPLTYGTTYFIRLIAKDRDGAAAAGAQGSGVPVQVDTADVGRIATSEIGDGVAPSASPTPTITNGIGYLYATWPQQANADAVSYEVHVSTATGFTPNSNTLVGVTPSNFIFIRKQGPGGTPANGALVYGTTYYVKLIAKDVDGQAAAGAQASGTPLQTGTSDISLLAIDTTLLAANAVTTAKLAALAVTTSELAALSVSTAKIQAGAVTVNELGNLAVTAAKIANNTITTTQIAADTITAGNIAAGAVTSSELAALAVATANIQASAVTTTELAALAVTTAKIAAGAVTTTELAALSVSTAKIQASAVTTTELAALAVTTAKIAANAVTTTELNALAVTTAKIAANAVTTTQIATDAVTAAQIAAGAVGNSELAALSVATANIQASAITTTELAALAVTTAKIAANAVTSTQIADLNVTTAKIADTAITTAKIVDGAIATAKLAANAVTSAQLADLSVSTAKIQASAVTTTQIVDGAIAAAKIAAGAVDVTKLNVMIGGGNIISNSMFSDTTVAAPAPFVVYANGAAITTAYSATQVRYGTRSLQITFAANAAAGGLTTALQLPYALCVPPSGVFKAGEKWTYSLWMYGANGNIATKIDGSAGQTDLVLVEGTAAGWGRYALTVTMPSDTSSMTFFIRVAVQQATAQTVYVSGLQVEFGDVRTAYAPKPSEILPGTVGTTELAANAVTAAKIAANTITASQIAANTITAGQIAALTITAAQIAANTITASQIAANTITAGQIAADTITAGQIAASAITSSELAAGAVVAGKITAGTIVAADIAALTITAAQIAANTITAGQIAADTITAGQIAASAITSSELAAGAVVAGKITAGTIVAADIAALTITGAQIAANTITAGKIAADTITASEIAALAITSSELAAGAVTAGKIAALTIVAGDIAASTITGAKIAANTITAGNIAADTITANEIAANAITSSELNAGAVTAGKIAALTIVAGDIAASTITGAKIAANTITAGNIVADTITAAEIAANAITSSELNAGAVTAGKIAALTIVAGDIAASTITGAKIAANTITAGNIAADTITANEIAANAITSSELNAGAVTAGKIAALTIVAGDIAASTITGAKIAAQTITATNIAANTITAGQIAAGTITATEIAAGAITAVKIAAGAITTEKLTIASLSGNLVPNGSFEDVAAAGALPGSWLDGGGGGTATRDTTAANVRSGGAALALAAVTANNSRVLSAVFPVVGGSTYYFSTWYKASVAVGNGFYFRVGWFAADPGVASVSEGDISNVDIRSGTAVTTTYQQAEQSLVAPAGAKFGRVIFYNYVPATPSTIYVDDLLVSRVTVSAQIADGAITTAKIVADAITSAQILAGTIVASDIAANTITASQIAAGTITANEIAATTITGAKIAATTITAGNIATGTITAAQMTTGTITAASGIIANLAIGTAQIQDLGVTTAKIADANISTAKIANLAVGTAQIADAAISTAKIGLLQVTDAQIAAATITSAKIASLAADKITSGTITATSAIDMASGAYIGSSNFVTGSTGWRIKGDGSAEFSNVTVRGVYETAASGARIRLSTANAAYVRLYSGNASESDSAFINILSDGSMGMGASKIGGGSGTTQLLFGPQILNGSYGDITMWGEGLNFNTQGNTRLRVYGSVVEIGRYLDFHTSGNAAEGTDFNLRINADGQGGAAEYWINGNGIYMPGNGWFRAGGSGNGFYGGDGRPGGWEFPGSSGDSLVRCYNNGVVVAHRGYNSAWDSANLRAESDGNSSTGWSHHHPGYRATLANFNRDDGCIYWQNSGGAWQTCYGVWSNQSRSDTKSNVRALPAGEARTKLKKLKPTRHQQRPTMPYKPQPHDSVVEIPDGPARDRVTAAAGLMQALTGKATPVPTHQPNPNGSADWKFHPDVIAFQEWDRDRDKLGFSAEEMHELFPEVVTYGEDGTPGGIQYGLLTVPLIHMVQEMDAQIEALEARLALLERRPTPA